MKYTDFENIISDFGLELIKDSGGSDCWQFRFKDVWIGRIHKTKKINRSILWISGFNIFNSDILNHLSKETVREAIQRKVKQIKTNIENARLKNVSEDF